MTTSPFLKPQLCEVQGWTEVYNCTPTALAAVTGHSLQDVTKAIRKSVHADGATWDEPHGSVNSKHWKQALWELGYGWTDFFVPLGPVSVGEFMNQNHSDPLLLVVAQRGDDGHVFAAQGGRFVDCHTLGKIAKFQRDDPELEGFVVQFVLAVEYRLA